jgi:hypothetical protein
MEVRAKQLALAALVWTRPSGPSLATASLNGSPEIQISGTTSLVKKLPSNWFRPNQLQRHKPMEEAI